LTDWLVWPTGGFDRLVDKIKLIVWWIWTKDLTDHYEQIVDLTNWSIWPTGWFWPMGRFDQLVDFGQLVDLIKLIELINLSLCWTGEKISPYADRKSIVS
jgi:hypothetical protein